MKDKVMLDIYRTVGGGMALCIGNDDHGHRLSGGKVGGGSFIHRFHVDADELIEQISEYRAKLEQVYEK